MLDDGGSRPAAVRRRAIPQRRRDRVERRAQDSPLLVKVVKQFTCPRVHAPLYRTSPPVSGRREHRRRAVIPRFIRRILCGY
jgi:hypothetical protein